MIDMDEDQKLLEEVCMNIEFLRCPSTSKEAKVGEFWKYLDSQKILKPYEAPKLEEKPKESSVMESSPSTTSTVKSKLPSKKPKPKPKKELKEKKDENMVKLEKYLREDLRLADTVEVTYDEINAELAYYRKQLMKCRCKQTICICKIEDEKDSSDEDVK